MGKYTALVEDHVILIHAKSLGYWTMTSKKIFEQLEAIASADDFAPSAAELTEAWSNADMGFESVEPILLFMEKHPTLDYGMPGPLVHFLEEFYRKGYEEKLIESVSRKPTIPCGC